MNNKVEPLSIPQICPRCGALDSKVRDEENYPPLVAIKCSECDFIYEFEFPE